MRSDKNIGQKIYIISTYISYIHLLLNSKGNLISILR